MFSRLPLFVCCLLLGSTAFAQQADLSLTVTPIGPGLAPWPSRIEFTVTNHGPARATNVRLDSPDDIDPLSEWANPTCKRKDGDTPWHCTAAVLEPGQSVHFAGNIGPAPATQPYTFRFSVRADQSDSNPANNDVPLTIDWADPTDISVDFIPPDPLGTSRTGRLVIDNRSDWPLDYLWFELSFRNVRRLVSTTPALQCRDAWTEPLPNLVWLNCETRGIPAHAKHEIAFEFELPEDAVEFAITVKWWLYEWNVRKGVVYARPFVVTSTADAGPGTMRQALLDANAQCAKDENLACGVVFAIDEPVPEAGWFTIRPLSPLPEIVAKWISVDGFTQLRKSGDTNPLGPDVELDGSLLQTGDGLLLRSERAEISGLAIGGFPGHGLVIDREVAHDFSGYNTVWHNYIGIDPTGAFPRANGGRGLVINRGTSLVEGNVLSGNARSGGFFEFRSGTLRNNRIGVRAFDETPVPNGASGIFIGTRTAGYGPVMLEGNTIAHNNEFGVALAPASYTVVQNNRIFANGNSGIDIGLDGPTLESSSYAVPPAPVLQHARFDGMTTGIYGNAIAIPGAISVTPRRVDFYANDAADAAGFAQGERYLGSANVQADGTFEFFHGADLRGSWITAIAVSDINFFAEYSLPSSSEFARAIPVTD
jgi:parallel beta-helix repeat protein